MITFPLMVRYLGTEGYGVNTQTNSLITFLVPIATLGLGFGVVRLIAGIQDKNKVTSRLYSSIIVIGLASLLLSILVYLTAPTINDLFIKVDWATQIIRWSAPLIFLTAIEQAFKDFYRARLRIIAYSIFQMIQTVLYVSGILLILTNGGNLLHLIWFWLGLKFLFNVSTFIYFLLVHEIEFKLIFIPWEELFDLLRFGLPLVIAGLGTWVTNIGDRWIIGYFMTITDVAIYNAAYTLAGVITAIGSPFWNPLYPLMSSYQNNQNFSALYHVSRKYTNGFSLITIPAVVGLTILANPLLVKFGSPDFSIQWFTFALLILGIFFDQFTSCIHYHVYLHNDPKFIRNAYLISGGSNIALNVIVVPIFGITGAAAATFLSFLILDIMLFRKVMSYGIRIRDVYDFSTITKYIISSAIMGIVVSLASQMVEFDVVMLFVLAGIGMLVYSIALLAFYGLNFKKLLASI